MHTSRLRILLALLVALTVGLMGAYARSPECGGSCCAKPVKILRAGFDAVSSQGCCCGEKAATCDLGQGKAADPLTSAIGAAPRVAPPAPGAVAVAPAPLRPIDPAIIRRSNGFGPPSQAPPTPLYLQNLSILC